MKLRDVLLTMILSVYFIASHAADNTYELYASNSIRHQSAANYGRYLFLVKHAMASITLYDLEEKRTIYTLRLTPRKEKKEKSISHCNQSCFGIERYDSLDKFPILYINQHVLNKKYGALMDAIRIVPFMDDAGRVDSFRIEEVQQIFFPKATDENSLGTPNAVIDTEKGYMYTYSRNNGREATNFLEAVVSKFKIPALRDKEGNIRRKVVLTDDDILDSFNCGFNLLHAQGGFFRNGRIYIGQGYPSKKKEYNYVYFRVIDLKKRKLIKTVDMLQIGFKKEPEGCWFYKGHAMIGTNGKQIYKLTGRNFKVK